MRTATSGGETSGGLCVAHIGHFFPTYVFVPATCTCAAFDPTVWRDWGNRETNDATASSHTREFHTPCSTYCPYSYATSPDDAGRGRHFRGNNYGAFLPVTLFRLVQRATRGYGCPRHLCPKLRRRGRTSFLATTAGLCSSFSPWGSDQTRRHEAPFPAHEQATSTASGPVP